MFRSSETPFLLTFQKERERIRRYNKRHVSSSLQSIPPKYYVRNTGVQSTPTMYYSVLCMYVLRILYSHTYRQARKYLCLDTVIYRFVVTCKRLHAQQWLTNLSTAITFFPNRPKVLLCVLTHNEMNYCLKKCNDTLWCGVPLLAQLAKNAQGHGRRYWTTITRNKLMKNNVSITYYEKKVALTREHSSYIFCFSNENCIHYDTIRHLKMELHTSEGTLFNFIRSRWRG